MPHPRDNEILPKGTMKEIEYSGKIKFEITFSFTKLKLEQPDGYLIDLVSRFNEISESYPGKPIQVSFHTSYEPMDKDTATRKLIEKLYGGEIEASYESYSYQYSSWTSGTDYNTNLRIGGHSLYDELYDHKDQYIYLVIKVRD